MSEEISTAVDGSVDVVEEPIDVVEEKESPDLEESEWPSLKLSVSEEISMLLMGQGCERGRTC